MGSQGIAGLVRPGFEEPLVFGMVEHPGEHREIVVGAGPDGIEEDISELERGGLEHGRLVPSDVPEVVNESPIEVVVVVCGALPMGDALGVGAAGRHEVLG
ncbi:MAG: hypothetical protein RI897_2153 [Verrucomicrobiota bacterium]